MDPWVYSFILLVHHNQITELTLPLAKGGVKGGGGGRRGWRVKNSELLTAGRLVHRLRTGCGNCRTSMVGL
jgi:hypothetical protein